MDLEMSRKQLMKVLDFFCSVHQLGLGELMVTRSEIRPTGPELHIEIALIVPFDIKLTPGSYESLIDQFRQRHPEFRIKRWSVDPRAPRRFAVGSLLTLNLTTSA